MSRGQFPGQSVPVPAGSRVPAHETGVLLAPAGERDGHTPLGEEDLLTRRGQVEGQTREIFILHSQTTILFIYFCRCPVLTVSPPVPLQVWEFSHLFSAVDSWHMADIPPISAHLEVCPYYETYLHREPVALPSITEKQEGDEEKFNLVQHFTGNRWQHS